MQHNDVISLTGFVVICAAISAIGGLVTAGSVDTWYPTLVKPAFNPPDWVFAPVWTLLYLVIAIAGWRAWRHRADTPTTTALSVYALQLLLNLTWSVLFFGLQRIDLAAIEIVVLLLSIAANIRLFARIDRVAALLLAPYLLWVGFATLLTWRIWQLNP